jgi:multisubunit Na+/H+ antiporter MnhG subunit
VVRLTIRLTKLPVSVAALVADDPFRREVAGTRVVPVTLLVLLVALVLVALRARGRLRRAVALLLLPVSVAWVAFNGRLEGPVLITFTQAHGVTVSDLLAVLGVLVALVVLVLDRRRRGQRSGRRRAEPPTAPITDGDGPYG